MYWAILSSNNFDFNINSGVRKKSASPKVQVPSPVNPFRSQRQRFTKSMNSNSLSTKNLQMSPNRGWSRYKSLNSTSSSMPNTELRDSVAPSNAFNSPPWISSLIKSIFSNPISSIVFASTSSILMVSNRIFSQGQSIN